MIEWEKSRAHIHRDSIAMGKCSIKIYINHLAHSANRFGSIIMIQTERVCSGVCVFFCSRHSFFLSVHRFWVTIMWYRSWLVRWSLICWNCVRKYLIILNLFHFVRCCGVFCFLHLDWCRFFWLMTLWLYFLAHMCTHTHTSLAHTFFCSRIHKLNNIDELTMEEKNNKIKRMFPISSNNFNKNMISAFFPSILLRHFDLAIYFVPSIVHLVLTSWQSKKSNSFFFEHELNMIFDRYVRSDTRIFW